VEEKVKDNIKAGKKQTLSGRLLRIPLYFIILLFAIPVIIHLGPVQKLIVHKIGNSLSDQTGATVKISEVDFSIFKGLVLKNMFVSEVEQASDTLAYIGEFSTSLEQNIVSLLRRKLHLKDLNIFEARINIHTAEDAEMSNLNVLLDRLLEGKQPKRNSRGLPIDLMLQNINLRNLRLDMEDDRNGKSFFASLKEGHIGVKNLDFNSNSIELHSVSLLRPECAILELGSAQPRRIKPEEIGNATNKDSIRGKKSGMNLIVGIVEINQGAFQRIRSDSLVDKQLTGSLDVDNLDVSDLNLVVSELKINPSMDIKASIESMSMEEHNGLVLSDLQVDSFELNKEKLQLVGLDLQTDKSVIREKIIFNYDSLQDFRNFTKDVRIEGRMEGTKLAMTDLAYFIPELQGSRFMNINAQRKIGITGHIVGTIDELAASDLNLTIDNLVKFQGDLIGSNITDPEAALVNLYISRLETSLRSMGRIIPGFSAPTQFYKLGPIVFTGDIEGFYKDFVIYGKLESRLGAVVLDTRLNTKPGVNQAEYSGEIALQNFDLKGWTGNDDFGLATLSARIEDGQGLTLETVKTDLEARLNSFEYKNYIYTNVLLSGILEKNLFDGYFTVNDPNVEIDFEGQIAIRDNYFKSDFEAYISRINPKAINLSEDYTNIRGNFNLSLEGISMAELAGSAELNDFEIKFREKTFDFNQVYFSSAPGNDNRRNLLLTSDILNASIDGKFDFGQLIPAFSNYIIDYHPKWAKKLKLKKNVKNLNKRQDFAYKFEIFDTKDYLELVKLNDFRLVGVTFEGAINLPESKFYGNIKIDSSYYKDYTLSAFGLALTNNKRISKLVLDLEKLLTESKLYEPLSIKSELIGDRVKLNLTTKNVLDSVQYVDLTLNIEPEDDKLRINIGNKNLQMFSANWEIDEQNSVLYGKDYLEVNDFVLSDGYRTIFVQDYKKSGLEFNLDNFDFLLINGLINYDKIDFAGEGKVYARVANLFKKPTIVADVRIPEFTLNGIDYGSLSVRLDDDGDKAYASLNLNRVEDDLRLLFNAEYNKETKAINGEFTARNMVMETFEFIIDDGISETKGIANIKANVGGTADDIKIDGTAYVIGGQTRIDYIGTLLDLGTETFTISEDFIDLTGVRMYDKLGNQATMTGGLRHDLFGDFRTDLNMSSDRFLALDTDNTGNKLYYGTGIGEISVDFSGPFSSTDIVISAVTGKGTVLNIPIEDSYYDVDESFIKFVPREEIKKEKDSPGFVNSMKLEGVDVDMNLTMTTDAQVNLIFDERLNDVIKGVGNGDLRITIARDGNFNIFGDYVVDRGEYLFTAWGIVAKPFKVRSGGQITWTGDPVNANLNLQADYDDLRAPVNVLLAEYLVSGSANLEQQARKRTRVDLTLKLGGTLYNPIVNFDLAFPELQGELRTYADSKMITLRENEADLNEQVAGLIMFRSFLPSSSLGNVFTSSTSFVETTYNTLSEFVSNQLSYLLSGFLQEALTENGFISGIDFEIGFSKNANLLQGAPQSDNYLPDEIEVHFKPRFQNDRWGFDYGTSFVNPNEQATTAITNYVIHDFVLEYYLTADRRLKLRAYGRWDKDEVQFQNEQKYGLGINYRKEFGSLTKFKDALTSDISQLRPEGQ